MYCGQCSTYIPQGFKTCPNCGIDIADANRLAEEARRKKIHEQTLKARDQKRESKTFSYLEALVYSLFHGPFYRDVFRRWRGVGLVYLAFMLVWGLIPFMIGFQRLTEDFAAKRIYPVIDQIPRVSIADGMLSFEGKSPLAVRDTEKGSILVLFDRESSAVNFKDLPAFMLLTSNQIAFRNNHNQSSVFVIPPKLNWVVTARWIESWVSQIERWLPVIFFPIAWALSWIMMAVVLVIYALLAKLAGRFMKIRAGFGDYYRLCAVAITPIMILDGFCSIAAAEKGLTDWLALPGPLLFILIGLWHNRQTPESAA